MKRETVKWLRAQPALWRGMHEEFNAANTASADALATDAEVKRLRKALRLIDSKLGLIGWDGGEARVVIDTALAAALRQETRAALKPKRRAK